jgi:hypothetical protein
MIWTGLVALMGALRTATKFRTESLKGRDHLEDLDVDGMITLK